MNNDVVQETLLHLPVQSLFRFRAVSKWWRDVIDSPSFRKLHNNNNRVCLEFNFLREQHCKLSIKLLDNGNSFELPHNFDDIFPNNKYVRFVWPIKGLICIYYQVLKVPSITICNPFLGQLKILPIRSPISQCGLIMYRYVGIGTGFDGDYKVVELVLCSDHGHYHAWLYSRRRDSWRELAGDGVFDQRHLWIVKPLKSSSKNGYFAHWMVWEPNLDCYVVLTFDMRNEVFRATKIGYSFGTTSDILAMDGDGEGEDSFVLFSVGRVGAVVEIYEQGKGKKCWKAMVNLEEPSLWRGSRYVVLKLGNRSRRREVSLYDYCEQKFVGQFKLKESSEIMEYIGSFISLE